jgi:predicted AAA+ superfamily ATPase
MTERNMQLMKFTRQITQSIATSVQQYDRFLHVIIGPRQVGKTTAARQIAELLNCPTVFATADSPERPRLSWIEEHWRRALALASPNQPALLIIDEVQKIQAWSEGVKLLWDEIKDSFESVPLKVVLLGSSALLMQDGLTESLAGRFLMHRFLQWSPEEMRQAFDLSFEQSVYYGGYPGAAQLLPNEELWRSYILDSLIETVLSRDILQLQKVGNPALLRSLFFLAVRSPSFIISYNKLTGMLDEAGSISTVIHYLSLLGSAFLVRGLPSFPGIIGKTSTPKIVVFNNALISSVVKESFETAKGNSAWWGRLVENLVGAHLLSTLSATRYTISYYRERYRGKDLEVDFIVSDGDRIWAIEVTTAKTHTRAGLEYFLSKYPNAKTIIIGLGGIPVEDFLASSAEKILT